MPEPKHWILAKIKSDQKLELKTGKQIHSKTVGFLSSKFRDLLINSFANAFISAPFETPIKMGIKKGDEALKKSIIDVVKRNFLTEIVIEIFRRGGLGYSGKGYLEPACYNKPFWEYDENDAKKFDINGNLTAIIDIKTLYIKYTTQQPPTIEELSSTKIKRSNKGPENAPDILHPLGILLESPWRHYNKLLQQTNRKDGAKLEVPFEIIFTVAPIFDHIIANEFIDLLKEYINLDHSKKALPIPSQIPDLLKKYFIPEENRPVSSDWILENWNKILKIVKNEAEDTIKSLGGVWIWILGVVNQSSAKKFKNLYQDDKITMQINEKEEVIWNSIVKSSYDRKYSDFIKKKEENTEGKELPEPEIDPNHPDYYLNNHTIDVFLPDVGSLKDNF